MPQHRLVDSSEPVPDPAAVRVTTPSAGGNWLVTKMRHRSTDRLAIVLAALLMVVSGLDHLHLWDIAYRHVATLGPLFLVQSVASLLGAVVLVMGRQVVIVIGSALLMLGTIAGFVVAATVGLFGFTLPVVTGWADLALVTEAVSAVVLGVVAARSLHSAP